MAKRTDETYLKIMSYNIKKFRKKYSETVGHPVSQGECAQKIGVSQQMWATWESEKRLPSAVNQLRIAKLFAINVGELALDNARGDEAESKETKPDLVGLDTDALLAMKTELEGKIAEINKALAYERIGGKEALAESITPPTPGAFDRIPVIGLAACNVVGWYTPQPIALHAPTPPYENPQNLFAIVAVGQSLIPEGIREGYLLYCDPTLEPHPGELICVHANDGTVTVKKFLSRDEEFIRMQGWNDVKDGVQKVMNIGYANTYVKSVAVVVIVRRRA